MSSQNVIIYISQEGGEIVDLSNLLSGAEVELDWVGSLNGQDVPIKVRLSDEDDASDLSGVDDEDPHDEGVASERAARKARGDIGWDGEHGYAEYTTREILRDHIVEHHGGNPEYVHHIYDAGDHHLRTFHRMLHGESPEGD